MATIPDYDQILVAVIALLDGTSTLTSLLARGVRSIVQEFPEDDVAYPLITVRGVATARLPDLNEFPTGRVAYDVQLDIFGYSDELGAIQAELDSVMETGSRAGAMDNASWWIRDIDTSGPWSVLTLRDVRSDVPRPVQQRSKTYTVVAAAKGTSI